MHEASLMQSALEMAQDVARQQNANRIHRIRLRIGQDSGVVPDALTFAFEVMRANTICANAVLEFEDGSGRDLELSSVEVSGP